MEDIVKMVAEKTGISESIAKIAVETVISQLKDKLPTGVGSQLESYLGEGSKSTDALGGITNALGGMWK